MTDTEKWKAIAERLSAGFSHPHGRSQIEDIAAALAEAAAEGEKYGWQRGHSAATAAIRARGVSHD